ncbi:MAG: tetratricopeptide repeat protein [Myxococcales bacterium]|nr:tetratricopeptide repeat protein [Myxococcales bacterium]
MKRCLTRLFLCSLFFTAAAPIGFAQKKADAAPDALLTAEPAAKNVIRPEDQKGALGSPEDSEREKFREGTEAKLSEVRRRAIKEMREILRKDPLYKNKADLLFRIAEKEWDEAKYQYFLARKDYDKQFQAYSDGGLKKKPEEPVANYSKALDEYKELLKQFPNYSRIDEVMYYLGRGLISADNKKAGASYMLRLTKDYPKSKYVTDAYLAVAEYYFDQDLLFAAKTNYMKVLENKASSQYPYALYKLGYVHYNLKEYPNGIKAFHNVVDLQKGADKRKVYFTQQAYQALVLCYAELEDGWKDARDYYKKQGGRVLEIEYLEKIAGIYNKQDKTDDEINVFEYLIGADKQAKTLPGYAERITVAYKKLENVDAKTAEIEKTDGIINRFIADFDAKGTWAVTNKGDEEAMTRSYQYREEQLDWLISWYHTHAQQNEDNVSKADRFYKKAAENYERYLAWFPESKDLYEKEFFLAEIYYFQTKQWDKAAAHYASVVSRDAKGKYSVESAYAVILCMEEKMFDAGVAKRPETKPTKKKQDAKDKGKMEVGAEIEYVKKDPNDKFEPISLTPLHGTEEAFVKACETYVTQYPKDKEVPFVSFRAAEIYINKGHYSEGIKRLEVIMEHHTAHKYAGHAAATLFDSNYRLRRWDQMERWGRYMMEKKNYEVLSKKQLEEVIAISINEYATELSKKGENDKAAEQMLRFIKEFPNHDKAPIALFNAAAITERAERTENAIELYETLIKKYPKAPQSTEAHFVLGALYESQTDFEKAATYFEKMASFPDVPQMADALYNAGAIRAALEQNDKAIEILNTYTKKFPERPDTGDVILKIADLYEKQGNWKKALETYDAYIKKFQKTQADLTVKAALARGLAVQKQGGKSARRDSIVEFERTLAIFKRLPAEAQAKKEVGRQAARAKFEIAEYAYLDYEVVRVSFPDNVLKKTLVKKAELLTIVEKLDFEVLDFKAHDVNAGALYRLGEIYYLFAKSLFDLPIPPELNEDEQQVYRAMLDDKATPLNEKSIEAMQNALKLAHKNHVYNEWSRKSATLLVKLSPTAFPVLEDAVINTEWPVIATFATTYIKSPDGKIEDIEKATAPSAPASGAPAVVAPVPPSTPASAAPVKEQTK